LGASKGGQARASALSAEQRREIARRAVAARWARAAQVKLVSRVAQEADVSAGRSQTMSTVWFEPSRKSQYKRTIEADATVRAAFAERSAVALARSAEVLRAVQHPEGYWVGDLLADTTHESDYILLQLWMHPPSEEGWNPPSADRVQRAAQSILARQLPTGGYNIFPDGEADVSASVKAYTALKLAGIAPDSEPMQRCRRAILERGGIQEANSYVKINLSLFGLYPREHVPTIPPELVLLPGGVLYEMSSWTRAIVVPLSIVQALGGTRPVPPGFTLDELAVPGKSFRLPRRDRYSIVFQQIDRGLKIWERRGPETLRREAIRKAEKWLIDHTRYSDGLGAIYPSMMYLIMALDCLGYASDPPDLLEAVAVFERLLTDTPDGFYF
jgi:squalene-hopene/tetraprenyl-beta-curcumene cyclase